ncbi:MAG: efflux RND transporter periplasmic adaptor subunit [Candidatus Pacebacteria bacterium]|nr:efflux RND transporter periplasmic adaptor subunit [Candidatus Paceibacterota bacterium]
MKKIKFPKFKIKNKKRFWLIFSGVIVVLAIATAIIAGQINKPLPYEFVVATKQTVIQEVSVTGKVKPAQSVDLAFERGGKIKSAPIQVGDLVQEDQTLVALDTTELQAQLAQAQANLESQQAQLIQLQNGARPEEINVSQTAVDNAQKSLINVQNKATSDLANLYSDIKDTLNDAYVKADDAVNKQTQELFNNANTNSPQITFYCSNTQLTLDSQNKRVIAGNAVADLKTKSNSNSADPVFLENSLSNALDDLNKINDFLNTLDNTLSYASLTNTQITTYKGYINTGRTNINTALASVNSLKQSISSQKITNQQNITASQNSLESAQKDLLLKQAGATDEQLQSQDALVKAAKANANNISAQIAKAILKAPITGVVTLQNAKPGEIAQAGAIMVSLISQAEFEIETNIPEVDVAKVQLGDNATVTLDAYGSDTKFQAKVTKIDPSETTLEGVATYKTTLQFTQKDERIKSGFTANVDILTAQKENVIAVPYRAVITKNGDKVVKVVNDGKITETPVVLGLRGSDGNVEITQGITEGDKVITFEKSK